MVNLLKVADNSWFTLTLGLAVSVAVATRKTGRMELARACSLRPAPAPERLHQRGR
jgi:hypothetical protein